MSYKAYDATEHGDLAKLRSCLAEPGFDVNFRYASDYYNGGITLLQLACEKAYPEFVQLLLDAHANPDIPNNRECTPLILLTFSSPTQERLQCLDILVRSGATLTLQNNEGQDALYSATMLGFDEYVAALLAKGAPVNHRSKTSWTPLHMAATGSDRKPGYIKIANLLLKAGADRMARDDKGRTPLDIAISGNHVNMIKLLKD